jgi:biotin-dependent carboxylase-like uncharacterized protein
MRQHGTAVVMTSDISAGLRIHRVTLLCQLQDLGRFGHQGFGVNRSGAMDSYSMRLANILAGNPVHTACLELALAGAVFEITAESVRVAFVGDFPIKINGLEKPANASHFLKQGDRLEIGATRGGTHGYLAVSGGFAVEPQLGSVATHLRSRLGGFGLPMTAGTILPVNRDRALPAAERYFTDDVLRRFNGQIRVIRGPQFDHFSDKGQRDFFDQAFEIGRHIDRMGYRLNGHPIEHAGGANIISEPVVPGCIQVPADGMPIVLMADCGTVGGYPKIATVISVDRGQLAQLSPGTEFIFEEVTVDEAQALLREQETLLGQLAASASDR